MMARNVPDVLRTGLDEPPQSPFTLSFALTGFANTDPDFTALLRLARQSFDDIRERHLESGALQWRDVHLTRLAATGLERTFRSKAGRIRPEQWSETLEGMQDTYPEIFLSIPGWAEVRYLASRGIGRPGVQNLRTLSGRFTSTSETVTADAESLLILLRSAATTPGVLTGFVHVDSIEDPYTTIVDMESKLSDGRFDVEVHGYYWAVMMTGSHIERFGGMASAVNGAPVESAETLGESAIFRLVDDPLSLTAEHFTKWRTFLSPVLRAGFPGELRSCSRYLNRPRANVLTHPVWLFEGPPVPWVTWFELPPVDYEFMLDLVEGVELNDPDWPTCSLEIGDDMDPGSHAELAAAVVRAWKLTGQAGKFQGTGARLHEVTGVSWETSDDGHEALAWQFDPGTCDADDAIRRLLYGLDKLEATLRADRSGQYFTRLVVA
jgi:hypothetical protein